MEWIIQAAALFLTLCYAALGSLQIPPASRAVRSWRILKQTGLVVVMAWLLFATHLVWIGALALAGYLLLAQFIIARGWLGFTGKWLKPLADWITKNAGILAIFAPGEPAVPKITTKQQLSQFLRTETPLQESELQRLLASLEINELKVADIMVPAEKIATVDTYETVGPLLLDRLHSKGHNIFVAVNKTLRDVKGLLYMSDVVRPHPEIKKVSDAIRPAKHQILPDASLSDLLAASLHTGRQFFLVRTQDGEVAGIVTLGDALERLGLYNKTYDTDSLEKAQLQNSPSESLVQDQAG